MHSFAVQSTECDSEYPLIPTENEIVAGCRKHGQQNRIVRLSKEIIVKLGYVPFEEYTNQIKARELVDLNILYIPKVYRYFSRHGTDYLVMEYVEGNHRDVVEDPGSIKMVARAIKHLQSFCHDSPGPLGGGVSRGLLWETEEIELHDISRMETYFNRRLVDIVEKLSFFSDKLVLNHLDIAPRNLIWKDDGTLCLIDWTSAGFYPAVFERTSLCINTQLKDLKFANLLVDELGRENSTDKELLERKQVELIDRARFNGHRYYM